MFGSTPKSSAPAPCTAELAMSSAVQGAGAELLGVLPNTAPSSRLGARLVTMIITLTAASYFSLMDTFDAMV